MKLLNFEEYIDDVMLKRGKEYFKNGHIENIKQIDKNLSVVEVMGSDNYSVEIYIDDHDQIADISCDCPYDWGEHCKHQAAALFALRQTKMIEINDQPKPKKQVKASNKADIKTILLNLQKEELIQIILNVSKEFPEIEKQLLFTYAPTEDEIASSKKLMKEYINRYKKRGFISWSDVYDALQGVDMTLEKAHEKIEKGETEKAVLICLAVLPIVMDMLDHCDDSSGFVGGEIEETIQTINEAIGIGIDQMTEKLKGKLYTLLMKEALHQRYEGWSDWRIGLLRCVILLCDTKDRRNKFEQKLNLLTEMSKKDSWNSKHMMENIKLLQLEVIETFDGEEQALQFIRENISLSPFRTKMIEYLLEKGDYSEVISLCEEGKIIHKDNRGIVSRWKKYQHQAYEGIGDIQNQRALMLEFLYGNEYSYYSSLKKLYDPTEWSSVRDEILDTFEKQVYLPYAYIEILKEEKLTEKMLNHCAKNLSSIVEFSPYLMEEYSDEVNQLYIKYIEVEAEKASNRKEYRKVCGIVKDYKKICGTNNTQILIDFLKKNNVRRPAFIDELGKIK